MSSNLAGAGAGTLLDAHVRGYAQAVRLHLSDLGPDVVEDLTDGLEADLAEALADAAPADGAPGQADDVVLDLATHFGPAQRYAAELRAAAGLPPAGPPPRRRARLGTAFATGWRVALERWSRHWRPVTSTPQWAALRELVRDLRPVWWVARGWAIGAVLNQLFGRDSLLIVPTTVSDLVFPVLAALVSVQWGRGRWLPWRWMPRAVLAVSLAALLFMPSLVVLTHQATLYGTTGGSDDAGAYQQGYDDAIYANGVTFDQGYEGAGIWVDGMQVSNLFAYDANGDPIRDVQLFDDRGRPVRTVPEDLELQAWSVPDVEGVWYFRPALAGDGRERWNVYPLRAVPESAMTEDDGGLSPKVGTQLEAMPWPFLKAPTAIVPDDATPAGPSQDGEPSRTPSPDPEDGPERSRDADRRDTATRGTSPAAASVDASGPD